MMDEESMDFFLDNDEYYHTEESLMDIIHNCMVPSLYSILDTVLKLILVNLAFGVTTSYFKIPQSVFNILSGFIGISLVLCFGNGNGKFLLIIMFLTSYLILKLTFSERTGIKSNKLQILRFNIIQYCLIVMLVLCQYYFLDKETWMEIRGPMMIFSMKLISLSDDIQKNLIVFPSFLNYFGYVFSGANIMFGPWLSFSDYLLAYNQPTKKSIWWICAVFKALFISLIFLIISNCLVGYFIDQNSNRWIMAYGEAVSFRTSHYFICYLSEAAIMAAGYKNLKMWNDEKLWRFTVTTPKDIEAPSALAIVVTSWNRPMHDFLKRYVYKAWLPLGKFYGILATFVISSFLHGFEMKVSVVLISIGIFSYIELVVRQKFARAFDCCIKVYACKEEHCGHNFKRNHFICLLFRAMFSIVSIIHLVFLGMIMDESTDDVGILSKWSNLYFCSFWIIVFDILIIL